MLLCCSAAEIDALPIRQRQNKLARFGRCIGRRRSRRTIRIAHKDVCHLVARCRRIEVLRIVCRRRRLRLHGLAGGDVDLFRVITRDVEDTVVRHIALHVETRAWDREVALGVK